jgi:hypothetical protein
MVTVGEGPRRLSIIERDQKAASRHHIDWPCSPRESYGRLERVIILGRICRRACENHRHNSNRCPNSRCMRLPAPAAVCSRPVRV